MARYKDARCKLCRREGMKLFLKGERCNTAKCAFERRGYPPGEHGKDMKKQTGYSLHLREKQKVRRIYGILERQFRKYFEKAARLKGVTGENLLSLLERRLDNVVFRLGFATSRAEARQLVRHGHFLVNGRKSTIASMLVKPGTKVTLAESSRQIARITGALETLERRSVPSWLEIDKDNFEGAVKAMPVREEITLPIQEQLIVELYSR